MLPKENRLTRMRDYEIIANEGRFCNGTYVTLKSWRVEPDKYPKKNYTTKDLKIGLVVSKKTHKLAVKRNRLKRQMREVVRVLLKDSKLQNGYMMFFMAKREMLEAEFSAIEKDIKTVLKKARILL